MPAHQSITSISRISQSYVICIKLNHQNGCAFAWLPATHATTHCPALFRTSPQTLTVSDVCALVVDHRDMWHPVRACHRMCATHLDLCNCRSDIKQSHRLDRPKKKNKRSPPHIRSINVDFISKHCLRLVDITFFRTIWSACFREEISFLLILIVPFWFWAFVFFFSICSWPAFVSSFLSIKMAFSIKRHVIAALMSATNGSNRYAHCIHNRNYLCLDQRWVANKTRVDFNDKAIKIASMADISTRITQISNERTWVAV